MNLALTQLLNPYDLIFLLVILVSFVFGVKNGLIKSLLNLIKWIVIFYLIKNEFTLTELQDAFLSLDLENKQFTEKRNFRKWLFQKSKLKNFIEETDKIRKGQHRPAKIFRSI